MFHLVDVIRTGSRSVKDAKHRYAAVSGIEPTPACCRPYVQLGRSVLGYLENVLRGNSLFLLFVSDILKQLDGLLNCLARDMMFQLRPNELSISTWNRTRT